MKRAHHRGMRGAWAILAWAAMLMFALQPVAAGAMVRAADGQTTAIELCSGHGGGKIYVDQNGVPVQKQTECEKCPNCAGAPLTASPATPIAQPIVFAYEQIGYLPGRDLSIAAARAPPRPPSQGPPSRNA